MEPSSYLKLLKSIKLPSSFFYYFTFLVNIFVPFIKVLEPQVHQCALAELLTYSNLQVGCSFVDSSKLTMELELAYFEYLMMEVVVLVENLSFDSLEENQSSLESSLLESVQANLASS